MDFYELLYSRNLWRIFQPYKFLFRLDQILVSTLYEDIYAFLCISWAYSPNICWSKNFFKQKLQRNMKYTSVLSMYFFHLSSGFQDEWTNRTLCTFLNFCIQLSPWSFSYTQRLPLVIHVFQLAILFSPSLARTVWGILYLNFFPLIFNTSWSRWHYLCQKMSYGLHSIAGLIILKIIVTNYSLYVYMNRWNDFRYHPRSQGVPWLHCWYCDPHWPPHLHHKHRECRKGYETSEWFDAQIWSWVEFCCTTLLDRCVPQCIHAGEYEYRPILLLDDFSSVHHNVIRPVTTNVLYTLIHCVEEF